ncbi:DUF58 domain-containing protein [Geofilum rubicundum]|uniref:DUF58 domain-containing protein n=1 Tax=Geofilum rubicundum TaxID=472113 RepID=UPI0007828BD4|nr:DUF58 domain-containing protein [Geofilum rubicundum]
MKYFIQSVYTNSLFYKALWSLSVLFVCSFIWPLLYALSVVLLLLWISLALVDLVMLYPKGSRDFIRADRVLPERFSNGDRNEVVLHLESLFPFAVQSEVIDEVPVQFQLRNLSFKPLLIPRQKIKQSYGLKPVERGEYHFGALNVFITGRIGFFSRRYTFNKGAMIKVYPSFVQMRRYEIMAISNRLSEMGVKKIRKMGHHTEFDQIRDYIKGDDVRTINWKATARKGHLMVNQYQDEKSQQVFCLVDMGRTMKMPFDGMTLLDYAINTSLVISNIALLKHDKTGLVTFSDKVNAMLPARNEGRHLQSIMEVLYNQQTDFGEHNMEGLYSLVRHRIHQRSLLILFSNFESLESARRVIPLLGSLANSHLLMVVFFENEEIVRLIRNESGDSEEIYRQAIAEKFIYDKKQIVKELERRGIYVVLTNPENLTVDTMNRYLEFKSRGLI